MNSGVFGARVRASGRARMAQRGRGRAALLLSTALGCSLLVAAAPGGARAQSIQEHVEGDINITQDVVNGEPFAIDASSDAGSITIDVGQANVTNGGTGEGYAVHAVTLAPDKLISISLDESTATGSGPIFGIGAEASQGSNILINAGAVEATGDGEYGIRAATQNGGSITIDSGTVSTTGGILNQGTADARNAFGVWALSDSGDIDVTSDSVTTTGFGGTGIVAQTASGDVSIDSGAISTSQGFASGIGAGGANLTIASDTIATAGNASAGIYVPIATGDVTVTSGEITTAGRAITVDGVVYLSPGIVVRDGEHVSITSDQVTTTGSGGYGITADNIGSLTVASGAVHTSGNAAIGINADAVRGAIDITSQSVITDGEVVLYNGEYIGADAILARGEGPVAIDSGSVTTSGSLARAIYASSSDDDVNVTSGSVVTTGASFAGGIRADSGTGDVSIDSDSVSIAGDFSPAIWADGHDVTITSGIIETAGAASSGIYVPEATGDVTVTSDQITTTGSASVYDGVLYLPVGMAIRDGENVTITSNEVTTTGSGGYGISADNVGSLTLVSGAVHTSGKAGIGISAYAVAGAIDISSTSVITEGEFVTYNGENTGADAILAVGDGPITIDSGSVTTSGALARGIVAQSNGGDVTIVSGQLQTAGADAPGILVSASQNADVTTGDVAVKGDRSSAVLVTASAAADVTVDGDVSAADGFGLKVQAGTGATVEVASGGSIHGALGAIALDGDSDATLTVAGQLSADVDATVLLGGGDDVVNLKTGANIEGGLYGGAGFDTLNLDSTINEGAGIGQSVDDVVAFEALNVTDGHWTIGGDLALETTLTGGTLVVTGSLTDDVLIGQNAALQIGNGGTTGALIGDLVIDGTAIFDRSDEYDFGGDVSGTGTLVKQGDAGLILSGAYNFTGTTQVEGGTIKIVNLPQTAEVVVDNGVLDLTGTDQQLASLSGGSDGVVNVDDGSLTVNQDGSTTFAGEITGDGSLTLSGGGTLNLTGDNTYTGPTTVDDGLLKVNGSITSDVTVADGGALGGSGSIGGDVSVSDGALVGPGNSPGTLTVTGDFTFASGSTYVAEVLPTGEHDLINVSGQTTIEDGATLSIMAGEGDWARLSDFTLLHSVGGLTGTFDTVQTNLAFLDPHISYTGTDIVLALTRNDVRFASFAANANQAHVANAIEGAGYGDALYNALVVESAEGSQEAYNALSGEIYAGLDSVLIQQARYGRELVVDRAATAPEGRGAWAQLLGGDLKFDGSADHAAIDSDARGLIAGIDAGGGAWRTGLAVSYMTSDVDSAALASKADVKSGAISAYLAGQVGSLKASLGASDSDYDIETDRSVVFPSFADAPKANFGARGVDLFAEVSVQQPIAGLTVEPFLGVSYETLHVDGFTEQGGEAALTIAASDRDVSTAELGLRVSASIDTAAGRLTPYASVAWRGVSGDDNQVRDAAFQNGAAFAVGGAPIDDGAVYDVGLRLESGRMSFKASYAGMDTERWRDQQGRVGLSIRF